MDQLNRVEELDRLDMQRRHARGTDTFAFESSEILVTPKARITETPPVLHERRFPSHAPGSMLYDTTFRNIPPQQHTGPSRQTSKASHELRRLLHLQQFLRDRAQGAHGEAAIVVLLQVVVQRQTQALEDQAAVTLVLQLGEKLHAERRVWMTANAPLALVHVPENLRLDQS